MSKCMCQDCCCEATIAIPCVIGSKETKEYIYLCNFHYFLVTRHQPFSVSVELKKDKIDGLSNLEKRVKEGLNEDLKKKEIYI